MKKLKEFWRKYQEKKDTMDFYAIMFTTEFITMFFHPDTAPIVWFFGILGFALTYTCLGTTPIFVCSFFAMTMGLWVGLFGSKMALRDYMVERAIYFLAALGMLVGQLTHLEDINRFPIIVVGFLAFVPLATWATRSMVAGKRYLKWRIWEHAWKQEPGRESEFLWENFRNVWRGEL